MIPDQSPNQSIEEAAKEYAICVFGEYDPDEQAEFDHFVEHLLNFSKRIAGASYQDKGSGQQVSKGEVAQATVGQQVGEWQLCPKCNGVGSLPMANIEYATGVANFTCNVCNGNKVIQRPLTSPATVAPPVRGDENKSFLDVLIENYQAQIAGFYNDDKTDEERGKRNAVIEEYQDLIAIFKSKYLPTQPPVSGKEVEEWIDAELKKSNTPGMFGGDIQKKVWIAALMHVKVNCPALSTPIKETVTGGVDDWNVCEDCGLRYKSKERCPDCSPMG